jgi:hypothetical protein
MTFAEMLIQYLALNEDSNKQRPVAVPYICYWAVEHRIH